MVLWTLPARLSALLGRFSDLLDRRVRQRFLAVFFGLLVCREKRRTATAWFRAAGIGAEFRSAYLVIGSVGRHVRSFAAITLGAIDRVVGQTETRVTFALDDTVSKRYGPFVQGAGVHRNPTPGPADQEWAYGHNFVTLARVVRHSLWGAIGLPIQALLYVRQKDIASLPPEYDWRFRTKLELAVEMMEWLKIWLKNEVRPIWLAMDGAYAKQVVLRAARRLGITIVSRLRHDAALRTLPDPKRPKSKRGRKPKYGTGVISLAKRAGARGGWATEEMELYGRPEEVTYKSFLATWAPAGGVIRVVLVKNTDGWVAYFCTDVNAAPAEILGAVSDRAAIEQVFHDVKEIWGAGQQQLRHEYANLGAWNMNQWACTLVELWAWDRDEEELVDRSASPWDREWRRPSHADRRKSLMREMLQAEIQAASTAADQAAELRSLAERLLNLAA